MNGVETSHPLSVTREQKKAEKVKYFLSPHNKMSDGAKVQTPDLLAYSSGSSRVRSSLLAPWILDTDGCREQPGLVGTAQPRSWTPGSHVLPVNW